MTTTTITDTPARPRAQSERRPEVPGTELDLDALRAFGAAADVPGGPLVTIEQGGFIIPGRGPARHPDPGKERCAHVEGQGAGPEEARSSAGSRQGRRASSADEARSPAHAFGRRVSEALGLEEFERWYPGSAVLRSSSGLTLLSTRVGVIRSLPYRGRLLLEIPHEGPLSLPDARRAHLYVPDVRVWAMWEDGVRPSAHHAYPDASICAYMPWEWIWGRDPLHELVDWCACWLAKVLHLECLNHWPGPQHCSAHVAMKRRMLDEYCRCGQSKPYRSCHYPSDRLSTAYELFREEREAAAWYLWEVRRRGWDTRPPWAR